MEFTVEEKKKIEDTMQFMLEDMYRVWKVANESSNIKSIEVSTNFLGIGIEGSSIRIDKSGIYLTTYKMHYDDMDYWEVKDKSYCLGKLSMGKLVLNKKHHEIYAKVIKGYEQIRELISHKACSFKSAKQEYLDAIDDWYNRFRKESLVEFDLPTQNQQKLEVREENGKSVGILDFGDKMIKIVTNGSIALVNKREEETKKSR